MKKRKLTRKQAIADLHAELVRIAGDDHSICYEAARRGIFCRGFSQWKFHELKEQYPQIVRSRGRLTRAELEDLADRWQLARQLVRGTDLACDTQLEETGFRTCDGWEEFADAEIARFHEELCEEPIEIVPAA